MEPMRTKRGHTVHIREVSHSLAARAGGIRRFIRGRHAEAAVSATLPEGNVHFGVAARCCGVHGGNDPFNVSAQGRPLLVSENDESDSPARQVLLVANVLVGRQQNVKTCRLRDRYQFAVNKPIPSALDCLHDYWPLRA
jgi:hypothetical protein